MEKDKYDIAVRLYEQALDLDPTSLEARNGLKMVERLRNGKDENGKPVDKKKLLEMLKPQKGDRILRIHPDDDVPIYQQIVQQVRNLVASGRLETGEELPPIRVLAEQPLVNANTVARAYRELAAAGVLTNRRTAGTYVADGAAARAQEQGLDALAEHVDGLLAEARHLNVSLDELLALIRRRAAAAGKNREK